MIPKNFTYVWTNFEKIIFLKILYEVDSSEDRVCGLVVRVPGYRSRVPVPVPGATRLSEKWWV
jgi:hypothetical protein